MSEHADALYEFLLEAATEDEDGRLISREPLYPVLMNRFQMTDPEARRARTKAIRELTAAGRVRRVAVRSIAVEGDQVVAAVAGGRARSTVQPY